MAIEVVSRPEKTLANGYLSRWNASKTPLIYKLSSNRFPTNNLDPISTITQYFYSLSEGGIVIADPSASNFIGVSFVKISGTQFIDGIYKILRVLNAGSFVIDGFTNESEGGGGQAAGNAQAYYKGYKGLVKVFVGSPEYHPYNANGTKPQIEIGTIDVDFNSSNIGICNVRSYIKPDLMAKFSDLQNNPNLWTSFSIEYAEIWEGSSDAVYQEDLIDGCNPFSGLLNTDFEDGLDDWDQLAPSGSGSFSQWVVGGGPVIPSYLNLSGINADKLIIPQTEKVYTVPATGDYEFGIRLRVPLVAVNTAKGIIGYDGNSYPNQRWSLNFRGSGGGGSSGFLGFAYGQDGIGANIIDYDLVSNFAGQIVDIRAGWYGTNETRIYVNDVIVVSGTYTARPSDINGTSYPWNFQIGRLPDVADSFLTAEIYSFFIDDDVFEVNEGNGFPTISNSGTVATGETSNTGQLTYWNNNVWQPE